MDSPGNAVAGLEQPLDRHLIAFRVGGVGGGDLPDGLRIERPEIERAVGTGRPERPSTLSRRERQHGLGVENARKIGEPGEHLLVGEIRIVNDQ
jgi:hypothetical protein